MHVFRGRDILAILLCIHLGATTLHFFSINMYYIIFPSIICLKNFTSRFRVLNKKKFANFPRNQNKIFPLQLYEIALEKYTFFRIFQNFSTEKDFPILLVRCPLV
jgi:hypothetical protein